MLATFEWRGDTVQLADDAGPLATIRLGKPGIVLPPLWLSVFGIGRGEHGPLCFPVRLWARAGSAAMRLETWSARTPYQLAAQPLLSLAATPFRATFLAPRSARGAGAPEETHA